MGRAGASDNFATTPRPPCDTMTEHEVHELIRRHAERAGSVTALAREWGVSQSYLGSR
jgi:hypothetical protein